MSESVVMVSKLSHFRAILSRQADGDALACSWPFSGNGGTFAVQNNYLRNVVDINGVGH